MLTSALKRPKRVRYCGNTSIQSPSSAREMNEYIIIVLYIISNYCQFKITRIILSSIMVYYELGSMDIKLF